MILKSIRKTRSVNGTTSLIMTLPKSWCDANGIESGSELSIIQNDILVITPKEYDLNNIDKSKLLDFFKK